MAFPDLDLACTTYCRKWCEQNGGSLDSISYLEKGFEEYRLVVSDVTTTYYDDPEQSLTPQIGAQQEIVNRTSLEQIQTLNISKTTTSSFKWSLTEGFKINISVKFSVGVPPIASGETSISTELSASSSQESIKTESKTWSVTQGVRVKPMTRVEATLLIDERTFSQPFHTECIFSGYVCSKSPNPIMSHYFWFHSISSIFSQLQYKGFTVKGRQVYYQGDGIFKGVMGIRTRLVLVEHPLNSNEVLSTKVIYMPIEGAGIAGVTDCRSK